MVEKILTPRAIAALKPAPAGKRYDRLDGIVPGLAVRVTDKGSKSYVLVVRYPGARNPTRRSLGDVGAITLEGARTKARAWLGQIQTGIDPREIEEAQRKAEAEKRLAAERAKQCTFAAVVEIFFIEYLRPRCRTAAAVERRIRNELVPVWADKPITAITRDDIEDVIDAIVKRPSRKKVGKGVGRYGHTVLSDIKMIFGWAVDVVKRNEPYKLAASPADRIKPTKLIGEKAIRTRVLEDHELRSLWLACEQAGYPWGDLTKMLLLTGCRLREVSDAQWREFNGGWVIPQERHKSEQEHRLPITDDMAQLLDKLPRFQSGDYLFSFSHGKAPVANFNRGKRALDAHMPADTPHFVFHDVRRSVRSQLSALKIEDHVAEKIIGHGRKGLQRVYDRHRYESEIREGLIAWQRKLRLIVDPPDNVRTLPVRA
jgi:integrase